MRNIRISLVAILLLSASLGAQPAIPTPAQFHGYELGERFTSWARITAYYEDLAKRTPLLTIEQIGETYEGRPLILLTITSEKNRARLSSIRSDVRALAAGEADAARVGAIATATPAVVWFGFGVHGNESSSAEAAMKIVHTLVSDPAARDLLDQLVVVIDPLQNPDGRERYIQWFRRTRGMSANANPDAAEHTEPWPNGRPNHYLIDMNRDWAWMSQKETAARVAAMQQWNPQVVVDFHEMSSASSYFFPPSAKPINTNLPSEVETWLSVFGKANAESFSKRGWPFFVGEHFDLFYPAYGDSWPSLRGAIGMTYEVAGGGKAGTTIHRDDGTTLDLSFRIDAHTTSGLTTLRTAARNREQLLRYTAEAARSQIERGRNVYFIRHDAPNTAALATTLVRQGIRVDQLTAPFTARLTPVAGTTAEQRTLPAGTLVVSTRQATGRLAETLLEKSPVFSKGFLEEQRTKTEADESDGFYDMTSWSLPLAMNVDAWWIAAPIQAETSRWTPRPAVTFSNASYGYLIDGLDANVYRIAGALLKGGIRFSVSEEPITVAERTLPRGTLVILKGNNADDVDAKLTRIVEGFPASVIGLSSGWTGATTFGSDRIHYVRDPKIGLVGGAGVASASFGMLWHTLDVDTPIPHTTLSLETLRNVDLTRYRVLVFPDGEGYADRLGKKGIEKLQTWLRDGGTLVVVKDAAKFLREKDVEISKVKVWEPPKKKEDEVQPERYNDFRIPGSTFRTRMNERSYLTFGLPRPPAVMMEGSTALQPLAHRIDNIVTIETRDPLVSGVAWPESLERVRGSLYLASEPYGKGTVVTFADDPHFRLFWRGTLPMFLNAVLYSPSFPR